MSPLLAIDVSNVCYRVYYSLPPLFFGGNPTQVLYGFFNTVEMLSRRFMTNRFAFCFDHKVSFRKDIFPEYKEKRKERQQEQEEALQELYSQIRRLRKELLYEVGFRNIFHFRGYESDDIMAKIALKEEGCVLVTNDTDLYQCLQHGVVIYNARTKEVLTERWFKEKYGISPQSWPMLKSFSGCYSDGIPGIPRVGEKIALRYIHGEVKPHSAAYRAIRSPEGQAILKRNMTLIKLPAKQCPDPEIVEDKWNIPFQRLVLRKAGVMSRL